MLLYEYRVCNANVTIPQFCFAWRAKRGVALGSGPNGPATGSHPYAGAFFAQEKMYTSPKREETTFSSRTGRYIFVFYTKFSIQNFLYKFYRNFLHKIVYRICIENSIQSGIDIFAYRANFQMGESLPLRYVRLQRMLWKSMLQRMRRCIARVLYMRSNSNGVSTRDP